MKNFLSFVALAVTTALSLVLSSTARADLVASTTAAPNPSGYATCTGTNSDNSTANWTVGGSIYYTSEYANPPAHVYPDGYHNLHPGSSSNPCRWSVVTSNNVTSGCATITGRIDIYYTAYPSTAGHQGIGSYTIPTPAASTTYGSTSAALSFSELADVNNAQYKVTSLQGGNTLGTVATPYL